jgi:hypothetical protein
MRETMVACFLVPGHWNLAKGTCGNYGNHPESCRRYPDPVQIDNHWGDMGEGCGFELHTVENFETIFTREMESR